MIGSEFLALVLSGDPVTAEHIGVLIDQHVIEDHWIDFKSGLVFQTKEGIARIGKPIDPAANLRKFVASFANADGGVLVIGVVDVDDRADHVDGCSKVGNDTPKIWAERALAPLAYHMAPPIRCHEVNVEGRTVLIAAVARSDRLIPCTEMGQLVYYMRHGDQSVRMEDWLVADLMVGRRQRPTYRFSAELRGRAQTSITIQANLVVDGFVPVESFVWGLVFLGGEQEGEPINTALLPYFDIRLPNEGGLKPRARVEAANYRLLPFQGVVAYFDWSLERLLQPQDTQVHAVAFVIPANDMPRFLQVTAVVSSRSFGLVNVTPIAPSSRAVVGVGNVCP